MLGSVIGDIIGSPYEFHNIKTKDFPLFSSKCCFTDDTILTCATTDWLLSEKDAKTSLQDWGKNYQDRTYENGKVAPFGKGFLKWLSDGIPYGAKTNGCIMRLSPVAWLINGQKTGLKKGTHLTSLTHNHPESFRATRAYLDTLYLMKRKTPVPIIKNYIEHKYKYNLSDSIDTLREKNDKFYCSCSKTVPQAIACALQAVSYEDAVRNAVSLGGDSDTLAAMAGGIAEIRFGIPPKIVKEAQTFLDKKTKLIIARFQEKVRSN